MRVLLLGVTAVVALAGAAVALAAWAAAQKIDEIGGNSSELNTPAVDGCPIQSPDGLSLYIASSRPGGRGGLDIWEATRANTSAPWGAPVNLGEPVNSVADDFCPTPVGEHGLFFVSREVLPGACGQGTSTTPTAPAPRDGRSPNGSSAPLRVRTASSTSKDRPGSTPAPASCVAGSFCTSPAALPRRTFPARSTSANARRGLASARRPPSAS
jgi:hypothetical protein